MRIYFLFKSLLFISVFILTSTLVHSQDSAPAIATLLKIAGSVEVATKKSQKGGRGRVGMLLFAGNKIKTSGKSKATVQFRDGSRFRLFQNSELLLDFSEEQNSNKRTFYYLMTIKTGSLRGRFKKGLQIAKIRTPTGLIEVKGTSLRITENINKTTISLSEGQVIVRNLSSLTKINPGQWLPYFGRTDDLSKKIAPIPNLLHIKTDEYEFDFGNEKTKTIELSVQLQNITSSKIVKRKGLVIFESNFKHIRFPKSIMLDENGYAQVIVLIDPPRIDDSEFKGLITIRAFMDEDGFDDVAEGNLVLKVLNSNKIHSIILDPEKGLKRKND